MPPESSPLKINLGFIAQQQVGFRRDFLVEIPHLSLPPDLDLEDFRLDLGVSRSAQGLLTHAEISAAAVLECARCLDEFKQSLKTSFTELYPFKDRSLSESGLLYPESGLIDFGPLVREYLFLEIPINPICKPDCRGLCPICGENRNLRTCEHESGDSGGGSALTATAAPSPSPENGPPPNPRIDYEVPTSKIPHPSLSLRLETVQWHTRMKATATAISSAY